MRTRRGVSPRANEDLADFRPISRTAYIRVAPVMAIPAVLLDLDFPAPVLKAIPILARTASLLAHLAEESHTPIGFTLSHHAEMGITFDPDGGTE